jgi:hypothetical protein
MGKSIKERTVPDIKDLIVQAAELVWEAQAMEGGPAHSIEQCFGDDPCRECRRYDAWLYLIKALEIGGHGNDQASTWKNRVDTLREQIYIAANVEQPAREAASASR